MDALRIYFSVIVTTARLKLCRFDPSKVSLSDGKVSATEFQDVPFVRFRTQLSTHSAINPAKLGDDPTSLVRHKERPVFLVNTEALYDCLVAFEVEEDRIRAFA